MLAHWYGLLLRRRLQLYPASVPIAQAINAGGDDRSRRNANDDDDDGESYPEFHRRLIEQQKQREAAWEALARKTLPEIQREIPAGQPAQPPPIPQASRLVVHSLPDEITFTLAPAVHHSPADQPSGRKDITDHNDQAIRLMLLML